MNYEPTWFCTSVKGTWQKWNYSVHSSFTVKYHCKVTVALTPWLNDARCHKDSFHGLEKKQLTWTFSFPFSLKWECMCDCIQSQSCAGDMQPRWVPPHCSPYLQSYWCLQCIPENIWKLKIWRSSNRHNYFVWSTRREHDASETRKSNVKSQPHCDDELTFTEEEVWQSPGRVWTEDLPLEIWPGTLLLHCSALSPLDPPYRGRNLRTTFHQTVPCSPVETSWNKKHLLYYHTEPGVTWLRTTLLLTPENI